MRRSITAAPSLVQVNAILGNPLRKTSFGQNLRNSRFKARAWLKGTNAFRRSRRAKRHRVMFNSVKKSPRPFFAAQMTLPPWRQPMSRRPPLKSVFLRLVLPTRFLLASARSPI